MIPYKFVLNFEYLADAPNGIEKLRALIFQFAVQGRLVPQDTDDEPAAVLLKRIASEKTLLSRGDKIGKRQHRLLPPSSNIVHRLPTGWEFTTLEEAGLINPRNQADDSLDVAFIPMQSVSDRYGIFPEFETRSWRDVRKGFTHFAEGDVGFAKITPCFENGKSGVFRGLPNGLGAGTTELHVFRPINGTLVPEYVWIFFKSPEFLSGGESMMTGSAGQKRVPTDYFAKCPFPLPPSAEQQRIVAKVDELMKLCDELEARQKERNEQRTALRASCLHALTSTPRKSVAPAMRRVSDNFHLLIDTPESVAELRKTIIQLAVQGRLVPQDPNDEPVAILLDRIAEEKMRSGRSDTNNLNDFRPIIAEQVPYELPEAWTWARFDDLFRFIDYRGKTPHKVPFGIRLITAKNVRMGYLRDEPEEFVSDETYQAWMTRGMPEVGDLLFTTEAPMGNVCIVDITEPFALAQRIINLHPFGRLNSRYLMYAIMSPVVQDLIADKSSGVTATGIKASRLKKVLIPLPPLAEQRRIVNKVDELMRLCDGLEDRLTQAQGDAGTLMAAFVHYFCIQKAGGMKQVGI